MLVNSICIYHFVLVIEKKIILFLELDFSSPGLYVSFYHNFSHFNLLLQNCLT